MFILVPLEAGKILGNRKTQRNMVDHIAQFWAIITHQ